MRGEQAGALPKRHGVRRHPYNAFERGTAPCDQALRNGKAERVNNAISAGGNALLVVQYLAHDRVVNRHNGARGPTVAHGGKQVVKRAAAR